MELKPFTPDCNQVCDPDSTGLVCKRYCRLSVSCSSEGSVQLRVHLPCMLWAVSKQVSHERQQAVLLHPLLCMSAFRAGAQAHVLQLYSNGLPFAGPQL